MKHKSVLKYLLLAGAVYFTAVALAHLVAKKIPGLFIYYNVPSTRYQDQIISFLAFGWASFFFAVSNNLKMIWYLLVAGIVAVAAVANINITNDFRQLAGVGETPFWIQTAVLSIYAISLIIFALKQEK